MNVRIDSTACVFTRQGREAGRYVLDDPFKPHLHPLRTPNGHCVTDCMPADHRHHKGLMFALRCEDINFWEEGPDCGAQIAQSLSAIEDARGVGVRQELLWQALGGGLETYREIREILLQYDEENPGFHWTWHSQREALRPHRLIMSPWSFPLEDGRKINYHGLGIRLPWVWAFSGDAFSGTETDGQARDWKELCGSSVPEVTWWGRIDGHWTPPIAAVTLRQEKEDTWFVLKADFAYLSVGPSNAGEVNVPAGHIFDETYHVVVRDR